MRKGNVYAPIYFTSTVPTPDAKNAFDTEVQVGVVKIVGNNPDGSPILTDFQYPSEDRYTYDQFRSLMTQISRKELENTYRSGQIGKHDDKAFPFQ